MSNEVIKNKLAKEPGLKQAAKIFGDIAADRLATAWSELDEDFAKAICNYSYGTMYSREILSQKVRELCAVMTLTALDKQPALAFHIRASITCGASVEEVTEAIIQAHLYAGIPCIMSSLATLKKVLEEMKQECR